MKGTFAGCKSFRMQNGSVLSTSKSEENISMTPRRTSGRRLSLSQKLTPRSRPENSCITPRNMELSTTVTKNMLHSVNIYVYDDIIDKHQILHGTFFKLSRKDFIRFGITDKEHLDIIQELIKTYNKKLPNNPENLEKIKCLLTTSVHTSGVNSL